MRPRAVVTAVGAVLIVVLLLAACGSGSSAGLTDETNAATGTGTQATQAPGAAEEPGAGAEVPSEAESAATGDIPDNQVFLVFKNPSAGYSIRYPEGWARKGSGNDVTFREKAN